MDRGDDDVELREDRVGQIERAVVEDVDLRPLEQGDPVELAVQPVDLGDLLREARGVEPVRDALERWEWSVIARYESPRAVAASAMSRRVSRPSLALVCA